ncbi:uncharacterized protein LOC131036585 [Cryptomeria japonica]|uniref:uncharacterized protein LOC131036585 n=1 Tax=Cryptomeria japonica TaxID=3369 RepID=UPI0025AD667E|nr:uncharacterized protein LOC131036585 [Cryptomeria japonica]
MRKEVRWKHPKPGWVKMNFDGAARGNPGDSGFGCLIRNESGECKWGMFGALGPLTNNLAEAEAEAMIRGIQLCVSKGEGSKSTDKGITCESGSVTFEETKITDLQREIAEVEGGLVTNISRQGVG